MARSYGFLTKIDFTQDPRPEIAGDSLAWQALLRKAWDAYPNENPGHPLFGALHGARCYGSKLVRRPDGGLKIQPGDPDVHAGIVAVLQDYSQQINDWLNPSAVEPASQKAERAMRQRKYRSRT